MPRIAPTAIDDESNADPSKNPHSGYLLRGHGALPDDAPHEGVSQGPRCVLDGARRQHLCAGPARSACGPPSKFPLKQATLELMTTPEQPGHTAQQVEAANDAAREAIAKTPNTTDPLLAPNYPAIAGQLLFGFGWDIDTDYSKPRGLIFPIGSFGATGFTGTSVWLDPGSDTYVILLANSILVRGSPPISKLRGDVATAAAQALRVYENRYEAGKSPSGQQRGLAEGTKAGWHGQRASASRSESGSLLPCPRQCRKPRCAANAPTMAVRHHTAIAAYANNGDRFPIEAPSAV